MKRLIVLFIFLVFFGSVGYVESAVSIISGTCPVINRNLSVGSTDAFGAIGVSELQGFLSDRGYLSKEFATGYFGRITETAVIKYQKANGINPTGFVGPMTRKVIKEDNCSVKNYSNNKTPYISDIKPSSGSVGSEITVFVSNLSSERNTVVFGNVAINGLMATDTITFKIPEIAISCPEYSINGCAIYSQPISRWYDVYVISESGRTSNSVPFRLSKQKYGGNPSIVDTIFPTTVRSNKISLWNLSIKNKGGNTVTGNVNWGDGSSNSSKFITVGDSEKIVSFSHTYTTDGTYRISFVFNDDDSGKRIIEGSTVRVISSIANDLNNVSINDWLTTGKPGDVVIIKGSGFTENGNIVYFGNGVMRNISSYNNGTIIYFNIPKLINPCDTVRYGVCNAFPVEVVGGSKYSLVVENSYGVRSKESSFWIKK